MLQVKEGKINNGFLFFLGGGGEKRGGIGEGKKGEGRLEKVVEEVMMMGPICLLVRLALSPVTTLFT